MLQLIRPQSAFEAEVRERLGLLPNFFRHGPESAAIVQQMWMLAQAAYLDNPLPSLFKERLLTYLARLSSAPYWRARHAGFLTGRGFPAGDAAADPQTVQEAIALLQMPLASPERIQAAATRLLAQPVPLAALPAPGEDEELALFHAAGAILLAPDASELPRKALHHALGSERAESLLGLITFAHAAQMWASVHPDIAIEDDMQDVLRQQPELSALVHLPPPSAGAPGSMRSGGPALRSERDSEQDDFLMLVGHDLRNPLAAMSAAVEVLQLTGSPDPRLHKASNILSRQTEAMGHMLDELVDLAQLSRGQISLNKELLAIDDVLREAVRGRQASLQEAGITVRLDLPLTHTYVLADRSRLGQIFSNLLSGAQRFMRGPGQIVVNMSTTAERVLISLGEAGSASLPGPPSRLPAQGQRRQAPNLGLAIAVRLAELHGALLEIGAPSQGAGFKFSMPVKQQATPPAETDSASEPASEAVKVLVIEDNRDLAKLFCDLLEVMGCTTEVALNARAGLERARKRAPDIVFCDLALPGEKNGFDFAHDLRADPQLGRIPLIAVTGHSGDQDRQRALGAGFDRVFAKPIKFAEIQEVLHAFQRQAR
ncbi:hybrid sensor histidine kinase/response regulator [Noviherbaspirillum massiliense]|uniref:hybrid sensor histidine kinase/response regulator n=1 Tax=Noviherbaspirillum massiliense TaxID=1465823 RepID=UPI000379D1B7|nr:hybrid sensor histidine kinase/response regulator [Noviherbaspirillum massiliense]